MARRMAGVARVTVSLRKSAWMPVGPSAEKGVDCCSGTGAG